MAGNDALGRVCPREQECHENFLLDAAMNNFAEHTTPGGTWIEDEENR